MKILRTEHLIARGAFASSKEFRKVEREVIASIGEVHWPPNTPIFKLNNAKEHNNGVTPIKKSCMEHLEGNGWLTEQRVRISSKMRPGPVDAVKELSDGRFFAVEWETGNISSSHRALNKMALGMIDGVLAGGLLIVPSRSMYHWLTDRIGNFVEIEPYFPVWRSISSVMNGVLGVIEI